MKFLIRIPQHDLLQPPEEQRRNGHAVKDEAERTEEGHRPENIFILCLQFVAVVLVSELHYRAGSSPIQGAAQPVHTLLAPPFGTRRCSASSRAPRDFFHLTAIMVGAHAGIISKSKLDIIGRLVTIIVSTLDLILSQGEKIEFEYKLTHQIISD